MNLSFDSWIVKIAIVLGLLAAREFVRLLSPKEASGAARDENSKWLIETLDSAAIAIGLVLFVIQPFLLQAFWIPTGSMEDTLRVNDRLLVSKLVYRMREPRFQDVVVFRAPPQGQTVPGGQDDFIKRCIGTPGDVVYVQNRQYFRKGAEDKTPKLLGEPYIKWSPGSYAGYDMKIVDGEVYHRDYSSSGAPSPWENESAPNIPIPEDDQARITRAAPEAVPPDKYLMLGDHRSHSSDSHVWGFVPRANIIGKAVCVFWPPARVGLVDRMSFDPRRPEAAQPIQQFMQ
jgi:signal peptidase I